MSVDALIAHTLCSVTSITCVSTCIPAAFSYSVPVCLFPFDCCHRAGHAGTGHEQSILYLGH